MFQFLILAVGLTVIFSKDWDDLIVKSIGVIIGVILGVVLFGPI